MESGITPLHGPIDKLTSEVSDANRQAALLTVYKVQVASNLSSYKQRLEAFNQCWKWGCSKEMDMDLRIRSAEVVLEYLHPTVHKDYRECWAGGFLLKVGNCGEEQMNNRLEALRIVIQKGSRYQRLAAYRILMEGKTTLEGLALAQRAAFIHKHAPPKEAVLGYWKLVHHKEASNQERWKALQKMELKGLPEQRVMAQLMMLKMVKAHKAIMPYLYAFDRVYNILANGQQKDKIWVLQKVLGDEERERVLDNFTRNIDLEFETRLEAAGFMERLLENCSQARRLRGYINVMRNWRPEIDTDPNKLNTAFIQRLELLKTTLKKFDTGQKRLALITLLEMAIQLQDKVTPERALHLVLDVFELVKLLNRIARPQELAWIVQYPWNMSPECYDAIIQLRFSAAHRVFAGNDIEGHKAVMQTLLGIIKKGSHFPQCREIAEFIHHFAPQAYKNKGLMQLIDRSYFILNVQMYKKWLMDLSVDADKPLRQFIFETFWGASRKAAFLEREDHLWFLIMLLRGEEREKAFTEEQKASLLMNVALDFNNLDSHKSSPLGIRAAYCLLECNRELYSDIVTEKLNLWLALNGDKNEDLALIAAMLYGCTKQANVKGILLNALRTEEFRGEKKESGQKTIAQIIMNLGTADQQDTVWIQAMKVLERNLDGSAKEVSWLETLS